MIRNSINKLDNISLKKLENHNKPMVHDAKISVKSNLNTNLNKSGEETTAKNGSLRPLMIDTIIYNTKHVKNKVKKKGDVFINVNSPLNAKSNVQQKGLNRNQVSITLLITDKNSFDALNQLPSESSIQINQIESKNTKTSNYHKSTTISNKSNNSKSNERFSFFNTLAKNAKFKNMELPSDESNKKIDKTK